MARLCEKGSGVLVMMDLDHFKQLNDTRGHLQGDRCLRLVAEVLRQADSALYSAKVRHSDIYLFQN